MKKVAIITDSNSGITQMAAKELGIYVLPMPFTMEEQEFFEDISLTQEQFYEKLKNNTEIATSQPSPESVTKLWDDVLQEYEEVVHIPMSSGLSGSCQTAILLAEDYDGRVQVVNNQRISVTQRQSALDAKKMADQGKTAAEIADVLMATKMDSSIYIMVDTLKYLKKGGRVTPAAAAIGEILRIKPVLQIHGEKLDAFAKARNMKAAKTIMVNAIMKDITENLGSIPDAKDEQAPWIAIAHTQNEEEAVKWREELAEEFPGYEIHIDPLSLSIACHIGPGALALTWSKRI
ncbi:MAG: DegV family protein [Lachnospiraceae bacterium]|nr:DegV family protein [Lachnospiraceae bacterium]